MKKCFVTFMVGFMSILLTSCSGGLEPNKYFETIASVEQDVTTAQQITTIYDGDLLLSEESVTVQEDKHSGITKIVTTSKRLSDIDSEELYNIDEVTIYYTLTDMYSNESGEWVKTSGTFAFENQGFDWNMEYFDINTFDKQVKSGSSLTASLIEGYENNFLRNDVDVADLKIMISLDNNEMLTSTSITYVTSRQNNVQIDCYYYYNEVNLTLPI